jgi:hypothetical protein
VTGDIGRLYRPKKCQFERYEDLYTVYVKSQTRIALVSAPEKRIRASGVVEGFVRGADPHLGQNISIREAESLFTASRGHLNIKP